MEGSKRRVEFKCKMCGKPFSYRADDIRAKHPLLGDHRYCKACAEGRTAPPKMMETE